jgi:hypothetical protein
MKLWRTSRKKDQAVSTLNLLLGAAGLLLFIVGVKRTYRPGGPDSVALRDEQAEPGADEPGFTGAEGSLGESERGAQQS